ncbi:hypothetical protein TRICI_004866 [Trichomonascus ciferrii]|uniref:Mitochondrial carrier protein LEU5 n=1 Tax=Trichomonascus ciferrii TaxID=44093 RepID=A0A642UYY7_9ASCO|nr:hypothetical protein TRICI_004866 [Trichomonascus ciferrii]
MNVSLRPKNNHQATAADGSSAGVVQNTTTCDDYLYHKEPVVVDKQSLNYVFRSGIAGGAAGCAAKTLIAPLDRVKILFQTSNPSFRKYTGSWLGFYRAGRHIYSTDGVLALFQGHSATLLRIFPYAAIKFVAYEQVRSLLIPSKQQETSARRFVAGSLSGLVSVFFTYPLDLVRVRLAYDTTSHSSPRGRLIHVMKKIYGERQEGLRNFYKGFVPTIAGMIPYAGVSFWAHDAFHDLFRTKLLAPYAVQDDVPISGTSRPPLTAWAQLTAGGLSGLCAQTASYPLEVIRRRMQVSGETGERIGMFKMGKSIVATRGFRGLFVGLSIGYIKVTPMFACSFFVYERVKLLLGI